MVGFGACFGKSTRQCLRLLRGQQLRLVVDRPCDDRWRWFQLRPRGRAAVQQRGAEEERRVDQLPFPKFTVGAFSAPAWAWNGVIGLAP